MNEQTRCGIYGDNGIWLSHKKEWNTAICSNMDGPRDDHNKSEKRQISYAITHMWHLKNDKWIYI